MAERGARVPSGPLTMLCGYLLLGLQPLPVRALAEHGWSAPRVVIARFTFGLVVIALVCLVRRRGLRTGNAKLLLWRGIFGGVAVLLYFGSVQLAGAGTATVLNYTYPLWANVFAVLLLGQRVPSAFWLLLGAALSGVYLIVDPAAATGEALGNATGSVGLGQLAGVASALSAGAAVLCIKRLRDTDESLTIIASFSVVGLLLALPLAALESWYAPILALPSGAVPSAAAALQLLAVGVLALAGHFLFTRGYKHTSVPVGTSLSLTVPVIAASAGAVLLDERLSLHFGLGALLVVGACVGIGWISAPAADRLTR